MTKNILLDALKAFTESTVKDLILPVKMQKGDTTQTYSCATVYKMRLPDGTAATKRAPYIIHQIVTGHDRQTAGKPVVSTAQVRSLFCVYCDDEQEGALMLLELMERLRIGLLKTTILGGQFTLDRSEGIEALIYPEDIAPYFAGEMVTTWRLPSVEREVNDVEG